MVAHGLVAGALFMIVAVLAQRTKDGSESLSRMGGIAFRTPVLAAVFLIIGLATLAMPGSPNFVGEILILFGTFEDKLVYGLVASAGVAFAAVYMIRLFQKSMHHRVGPRTWRPSTRAISACSTSSRSSRSPRSLVALGVYPNFLLERTDATVTAAVKPAETVADASNAKAPAAPVRQVGPPGQPAPGAPEAVPQGTPPPGAVPQGARHRREPSRRGAPGSGTGGGGAAGGAGPAMIPFAEVEAPADRL